MTGEGGRGNSGWSPPALWGDDSRAGASAKSAELPVVEARRSEISLSPAVARLKLPCSATLSPT